MAQEGYSIAPAKPAWAPCAVHRLKVPKALVHLKMVQWSLYFSFCTRKKEYFYILGSDPILLMCQTFIHGPFVNRLVTDPQEFLVSHRTSATTFLDSGYQIFTLVFCSKGLWATKLPRVWPVWQRESTLLQLLGFLAGIMAGNLLGINSKLISGFKGQQLPCNKLNNLNKN